MMEKLDNPVWHSLVETQREFAIDFGNVRFYDPDYCSFGALEKNVDAMGQIDEYSKLLDNFFIVGSRPTFSPRLYLRHELVCLQMVISQKTDLEFSEEIIRLNGKFDEQLFDLVNSVQPGYFRRKTVLMGNYYGIIRGNELVAVAGERMKMNEYIEISAVVTHPRFTGRGYAK